MRMKCNSELTPNAMENANDAANMKNNSNTTKAGSSRAH